MLERRQKATGALSLLAIWLLVWTAQPPASPLAAAAPIIRGGGGMVAAAHPIAATVGAEMLARGGNAVDAAIAVSAVLGVVEPFASGLGGGGVALVYEARTGRAVAIDCYGAAPANAGPDMFLDPATGKPHPRDTLITGGLSVATPALARCWEAAHARWATKPLAELIDPAIVAADDGFTVTNYFHRDVVANRGLIALYPATAKLFMPDSQPLSVGSRLRQPELAASLRTLAREGVEAWYHHVAPDIAQVVAAPPTTPPLPRRILPGGMTAADVVGVRAAVSEPMRGTYRGRQILTAAPASGGVTLVQTLGMLESFDLAALGAGSPTSVHLIAEAQRVANADRARWVGDPSHVSVPCAGLTQADYLAARRALIAVDRTPTANTPAGNPWEFDRRPCAAGTTARVATHPVVEAPSGKLWASRSVNGLSAAWWPNLPDGLAGEPTTDDGGSGTSHFSIIDRHGNAVAWTQTLSLHFGSGITTPNHGILLNNSMTNFRIDPSLGASPNFAAPNKRPRTSVTPTIVLNADGQVEWVIGAAGAEWIIGAVAQIVVGVVDWGLAPQAVVDRGRFLPENARGAVALEGPYFDGNPTLVAALRDLGHAVSRVNGARASAQMVHRDPTTGDLVGGADRRRDGAVSP